MSPDHVAPAKKHKLTDFFQTDQLVQLQKLKPGLIGLKGLIDSQLKKMASEHLDRVHAAEGGPRHALAIATLGWWNGLEGKQLVNASLVDPADDINSAAFQALGRFRHGCGSLSVYRRHEDARVRALAADLTIWNVDFADDEKPALRALGALMADDSELVRQRAYAAFDQIAVIRHVPLREQPSYLTASLASKRSAVVLDAIDWLDKVDVTNSDEQQTIQRKLRRCLYHRDAEVRRRTQHVVTKLAFRDK